jgi:CheY-like chemotaxis protein
MNVLIVCNHHINSALEKKILDARGITVSPITKLEFKLVKNRSEFNDWEFNIFPPDQIFILTVLNWKENRNTFSGYEIAIELFEKVPEAHVANIQFISFFNRELLLKENLNQGMANTFIKSFPHHSIFNLKPSFKLFSYAKWNYLKKYALTEYGILDKILHDIPSILKSENSELLVQTSKFSNRLIAIKNIIGGRINIVCEKYNGTLDKNPQNAIEFVNTLVPLIKDRIIELTPKKNKDYGLAKKVRPKVLLLEDDKNTLMELAGYLKNFFEVVDFENGSEVLEELEIGGGTYSAIICDLELLNSTKLFDQEVQGIEVLEYAERNCPHIVRKVITGLPRKGVLELLPKMSYEDVIFKSLIQNFGMDELLYEFVTKLETDIKKYSVLLRLIGPDNRFWGDYTRQGGEGGRFKRYYYELLIEDPNAFETMWGIVYQILDSYINNEEIQIPSSFGKEEDSTSIFADNDPDKKRAFLQQILIHRLVMIYEFKNDETVVYKDNYNKDSSYYHKNIWHSSLPENPKRYSGFLGFSFKSLSPTIPTSEDDKITFTLFYNQLFEKEIKWIKANTSIKESRITIFYNEHEDLCRVVDQILWSIHEDNRTGKIQLKNKYPNSLKENVFDIDENYAVSILDPLSRESKVTNRSRLRNNIYELLSDFTYNESDENHSNEFIKLPKKIKILINNAIENL